MNLPGNSAELCTCGSGLRALRCCALDPRSLPMGADAIRHVIPIVERAVQAHSQDSLQTAAQLCLEVLELAPDRPRALGVLYEIRKAQGNHVAAEALLRRLVAFDPNNLPATIELTHMLLRRGSFDAAETHARNAVRIAPDDPQAHNLMGLMMTEIQRPRVGEYHYRRVLELGQRRDPILLANLAWNLKLQGRMGEARALYEESTAAEPDIPQTLLGWARLEEADRNFSAAAEKLERLHRVAPDFAAGRLARATLLGRMGQPDEAIAVLDSLAADQNGALGVEELAEKGRLLDSMGRFDQAWDAFEGGKHLLREAGGAGYLHAEIEDLFARLTAFFTAERMRLLPRARRRTDVAQPVFIVGFPRSGTTLVEQTLSAHSRVTAGDELPYVGDITQVMPRLFNAPLAYPEALSELWMGDQHDGLDNLRDLYFQKVGQLGILSPETALFTDKMPLNEAHLGLIALMFPDAPLIHVIRHPLDVMVSAMANQFTHGGNCASTLESAALHYVRVTELVSHYRNELTLRYLPLRYETMIDQQEDTVRGLLSFIGLDFEPECLAFHENRRYARTASYAQVTEKLYDRSRGRWRHYRKRLEPVIPILRPVIEMLGYTLE